MKGCAINAPKLNMQYLLKHTDNGKRALSRYLAKKHSEKPYVSYISKLGLNKKSISNVFVLFIQTNLVHKKIHYVKHSETGVQSC